MVGRPTGFDSDGFRVNTVVDSEGRRHIISEIDIEVPPDIREQAAREPVSFRELSVVGRYRQEVLDDLGPGDVLEIISCALPFKDGHYVKVQVLEKATSQT